MTNEGLTDKAPGRGIIRTLTPDEHEVFAGAVILAVNILPAWRDPLGLMRPFMDETATTAYTDRYSRVGLSSWFFNDLDANQRASVLLHEASHVLYNCFIRGEILGAEPQLNNVASDLEINSTLNLVQQVDLSYGILPTKEPFDFPDLQSQEQYYFLLKQKNDDQKEEDENCPVHGDESQDNSSDPQDGNDPGDQGDDQGSGSDGDQDGDQGSGDSGEGQGQGEGEGSGAGQGEGSGQGGNQPGGSGGQPGGQGGHGHGDPGAQCTCKQKGQGKGEGQGRSGCDHASEGRIQAADDAGIERASDAEQTIAKRNTAVRLEEARRQHQNSHSAGSGTMDQFYSQVAKRLKPPKVDWRVIFRRVFSTSNDAIVRGRSDYSYRRTSRRLTDTPYIFPGMVKYLPTAMLGVDTSGSMGTVDFERVLMEVEGIMKNGGSGSKGLKVFSIDTTIQNVKPVQSVKDMNFQGGGGTDMAVAFEYINTLNRREKPDIFVLATDGYTDWNRVLQRLRESHGKYMSIILVTQAGGFSSVPPELMKFRKTTVIDISKDELDR